MAKKVTIDKPRIRTFECVHLVAVLLNEEEQGALRKIMALRRCEEDSAIGLALKSYLPDAQAKASAPTLPTLPFKQS